MQQNMCTHTRRFQCPSRRVNRSLPEHWIGITIRMPFYPTLGNFYIITSTHHEMEKKNNYEFIFILLYTLLFIKASSVEIWKILVPVRYSTLTRFFFFWTGVITLDISSSHLADKPIGDVAASRSVSNSFYSANNAEGQVQHKCWLLQTRKKDEIPKNK